MGKCKHCEEPLKKGTKGFQCYVCKNGLFRYGLNRAQQTALLESQGGRCKLCGREVVMFGGTKGGFLDHDHSNGRLRGILCLPCNTTVGYIETNIKLEALKKHIEG